MWTLNTDGAYGVAGAGVGAVITTPEGQRLSYSARLAFPATNNTAEYEALLFGLAKLKALGARQVLV